MARIDLLYQKQEQLYRDCCEINNCTECPHCNGNFFRDCDLTLIGQEIEKEIKGEVER